MSFKKYLKEREESMNRPVSVKSLSPGDEFYSNGYIYYVEDEDPQYILLKVIGSDDGDWVGATASIDTDGLTGEETVDDIDIEIDTQSIRSQQGRD